MLAKFLLQPLQRAAGDVGEGLLGGHQSQVVVGRQAKQTHHLAHHLAVLAGEHNPSAEIVGLLKGPDHRSQLDGLRTGAQHDRDKGLGHRSAADQMILRRSSAKGLVLTEAAAAAKLGKYR